ncbi:hypothetical protein HK405_005887, partial [Cladochytrium tenue]
NILIGEYNPITQQHPRIVISDFGLSKRFTDEQSSFNHTVTTLGGTVGWRAPEIMLAAQRMDALIFRLKLSPTFAMSEPASSGDEVAELLKSALHISSYSRSAPRLPQPSPADCIVEGATASLVLDSALPREILYCIVDED